MMFKDKKLIEKLTEIAQKALSGVAGDELTETYYVPVYIDNFGVNSAVLTDGHKATLDRFADGDEVASFPYRPGRRVAALVGLASQTGPENNNLELGRKRAEAVYDYLKLLLPEEDLVHNISSLGSSQPRPGFDSPGSEYGENRAVAMVMEMTMPILGVITPPAWTPEPGTSKKWEIRILWTSEFGTPGIEILGGQIFRGELKNVQTGDVRIIEIYLAGVSAALELAPPIGYGWNVTPEWFAFEVGYWAKWSDFDGSAVSYIGAGVSNVVSKSRDQFIIHDVSVAVEPETLVIKTTAVGVGVQIQMGMFRVLPP